MLVNPEEENHFQDFVDDVDIEHFDGEILENFDAIMENAVASESEADENYTNVSDNEAPENESPPEFGVSQDLRFDLAQPSGSGVQRPKQLPVRFTRENVIEPTANDEESADSTDTDSQSFFESSQEEEPRRSQRKKRHGRPLLSLNLDSSDEDLADDVFEKSDGEEFTPLKRAKKDRH